MTEYANDDDEFGLWAAVEEYGSVSLFKGTYAEVKKYMEENSKSDWSYIEKVEVTVLSETKALREVDENEELLLRASGHKEF